MTRQTLLIDGDALLYRAAAGVERELDLGDGIFVASTDLDLAKHAFEELMRWTLQTLPGDVIVTLTDRKGVFRHALSPDYKSGRGRKPLGYWSLRAWVEEEYETRCFPNLEADDVMGILATSGEIVRPLIVSPDKDMLSIPGRVHRLGETHDVSLDDADYWHLFQTLTGDTTDGYKGCPGIGAVKAEKLLRGVADPWQNVIGAFLKAGLTEDDALLQARLARILRASDWDAANQTPILWSPPSCTPSTSV